MLSTGVPVRVSLLEVELELPPELALPPDLEGLLELELPLGLELTPADVLLVLELAAELVPVAVPVLAMSAAVGAASEPLAPQAVKTTQHATMDALRPKDNRIDRPGI
jgi:hypothetical protein